jgi:hypothetical protein
MKTEVLPGSTLCPEIGQVSHSGTRIVYRFIGSLLLGLGLTFTSGAANPLPAVRTPGGRGSWAGLVGVPGGIPTRTTIYATLSSGASQSSIETALNNCPSNSVVLLGPGSYSIGTMFITKNGVTLRGSGKGSTTLNVGDSVNVGTYNYWWNDFNSPANGNHVNWTAGLSQGSTNITVASTSGYSVGQLIFLDQLNNTNTSYTASDGMNDSGEYTSVANPGTGWDRFLFQINRIYGISGNTITLYEPVYDDQYDINLTPQTWRLPTQPVCMVGLEDMSINGLIRMDSTYGCWIKNVKQTYTSTSYTAIGYTLLRMSLRGQMEGCDMIGPVQHIDNYGIQMRIAAGFLVQNNSFSYAGSGVMANGCSGCVFAYNVMTNITTAASPGNWMTYGIIQHGGMPHMNLYEGNVAPGAGIDNTGGGSLYAVLHRNWFRGIDQDRTAIDNINAIEISATNRYVSVIGNVLGTVGVTYYRYQNPPNCTSMQKWIYSLGHFSQPCGTFDAVVTNTLLRAYNWDQYNNAIVADGYSAGDIPSSYYLTSKPSWFGSLAWPPIEPSNPTYSRSWTNVPAGYRYVYGVEPAPGGPDLTPPSAPTLVVSVAAGTNQINLSWSASSDNVGVTGYLVERQGPGSTNYVQVGTSASTNYSDTGLAAGTSYSYRVRARDAAGNLSPYSAVASATTLVAGSRPLPPTGFHVVEK